MSIHTAADVVDRFTSDTFPDTTDHYKENDRILDAIYYREKPYTARKLYQGTTHRSCAPEETYERILPVLPQAGITRMADVTGLDRIGIPTILAMRPNAPTLSNSSGKGFTTVTAMVSAAMEGIELFCAEEEWRFPFDVITGSYDDLVSDGVNLPAIELLPLSSHSLFSRLSQERWVLGWDIMGQREMAVPFEMVTMIPALGEVPATFSFQIGSNGLASGNVFLEAICSALYEVIERDAVTNSNILADHDVSRLDRLMTSTIPYDTVQELLGRLEFKGITPLLFDCTVDTQIPTYEAYLLDRDIPSTGIFRGYGSHFHSRSIRYLADCQHEEHLAHLPQVHHGHKKVSPSDIIYLPVQ